LTDWKQAEENVMTETRSRWQDDPVRHTARDQADDPVDAADPHRSHAERQHRVGSAGGGPYHPDDPQHRDPERDEDTED
jgi:hypothetical protein